MTEWKTSSMLAEEQSQYGGWTGADNSNLPTPLKSYSTTLGPCHLENLGTLAVGKDSS